MHGKADDLIAAIDQSSKEDNVPWKNVLQVTSDSPNVMRGSKSGVVTKIKERLSPSMIGIGGCSLHYLSNAVSQAMETLGE